MARPRIRRTADRAFTNNSGTFNLKTAISYVFTFALTQIPIPIKFPILAPAPTSTFASSPDFIGKYTDENLQRATKLALKLFVKG